MIKKQDLNGAWTGEAEGLGTFPVVLPGTLDTNGIGRPDEKGLKTRLTRLHTYEGRMRYSRQVTVPQTRDGRLFIKVERTKELSFEIDGCAREAFMEGTLSTPWLFEITEYAGKGVTLALTVDNYYTNWPRASIIGASASTDETQTNWNGILGDFAIYEETPQFFGSFRVYPVCGELSVRGTLCGLDRKKAQALYIKLESEALKDREILLPAEKWLAGEAGCNIKIDHIPLAASCKRWDEGEGNLYALRAELRSGVGGAGLYVEPESGEGAVSYTEPGSSAKEAGSYAEPERGVEGAVSYIEPEDGIMQENHMLAVATVTFGVRDFSVDEGLRLTLNGRRIFLRGEANCCVFPEEGHPPMTEEGWRRVLAVYASYGVNCMRFHSWCPPEAAFFAADKMGMLMQPELSQWNFKDAFGNESDRTYYRKELHALLDMLANHPSFVMLTFGNELQFTEEGAVFAKCLLDEARACDQTRLYANASNYHYGETGTDPASDFYTSMAYNDDMLRATSSPMIGHLNHVYPSACHTYEEAVGKVYRDGKPVFGFEVGQYEILPEFSEIGEFQGVTRAVNLELVKAQVTDKGRLSDWPRYVEATGELSLLCYREEVEAALRTEGMSGLSLLGLQDFPGQGTALVGMLNSHLEPKPYAFAKPERFRAFFAPTVPLLYLVKYTYVSGERLTARFCLAHYGKKEISCEAGWELREDGKPVNAGSFPLQTFSPGTLADVGDVCMQLPAVTAAGQFELRIYAGIYENCYPVWVYAEEAPDCPDTVTVADRLTPELLQAVEDGQTVFLEPEPSKEHFPASIGGQFTTDFWSVGTFPKQEGAMGMVIDSAHPALAEFPTGFSCNYQWWPMAGGRPMILPERIRPIVTVPDSCTRLKHMGLLFEGALGRGRIMVSSMGLLGKQQYPECRGLLQSLLHYLGRVAKCPEDRIKQQLTREELMKIVSP